MNPYVITSIINPLGARMIFGNWAAKYRLISVLRTMSFLELPGQFRFKQNASRKAIGGLPVVVNHA